MAKRENPQVTIRNLRRELHNVTIRCSDLREASEKLRRLVDIKESRIAELNTEHASERQADIQRVEDMREKLCSLQDEYAGYRKAFRELASTKS